MSSPFQIGSSMYRQRKVAEKQTGDANNRQEIGWRLGRLDAVNSSRTD
jgi:hypothetical protein